MYNLIVSLPLAIDFFVLPVDYRPDCGCDEAWATVHAN